MGAADTCAAAANTSPPSTSNDNIEVYDDASGDEDDSVPSGAPVNLKQKRRVQKSVFELFLASPACQNAFKARFKNGTIKEAEDDEQTVHAIIAQSQTAAIVKNPREYQIELFERAKHENTIAVLDTGSGKTLIAVLLLQWIIDNELESRAAGKHPRISFFLVASVNLVYQQYSVLDVNLDHKIARLSGADNKSSNSKLEWQNLMSENKVIVCTAEILFQNLSRGYINMKQINLLVFDEAHHTKKNHSYARYAYSVFWQQTPLILGRIVKDFYIAEPDRAARPRIFGMTASPIDAKTDVVQAASELENLLDCRIATTSNMSLAEAIKKPSETILTYLALPRVGLETTLLQQLEARYGHMEIFATIFARAVDIARHLGRWCADRHLVFALSSDRLKKFEMKVERSFYERSVQEDPEKRQKDLDEALKQLNEAIDFAQKEGTIAISDIDVRTDVSTKVSMLFRYLSKQYERETDQRCIVFVTEKITARLMCFLSERLGTKYMHSAFLVGQGGTDSFEENLSIRQQIMTLAKFRKGITNCLFATSVAEEGLDVPDCNLVVRFDQYATMIQYVQSRGRARKLNSTFIHMIEDGNSMQKNMLSEVRYQEISMRHFCNSLPEDRKLLGNQDGLELLLEQEKNIRTYTEKLTGAKLTYGNALNILATFVSAIPTDSDEPMHPTFVVVGSGAKFVAEVILPGNAPIRSVQGRPERKKRLAKCSAAFDACIELRRKQYMDGNFNPVYQKKLPAMRNALLAAGMHKSSGYDMQVKPKVWAEHRGTLPSKLWITLIDFPQGLKRAHGCFAFLTRTAMPQFPSFPVFLEDGHSTKVVSAALSEPLTLNETLLEKFTAFTMTVFHDIFSKTYLVDASKLSYWMAPASIFLDLEDNQAIHNLSPEEVIDWDLLEIVATKGETQWTPDLPNSFLVDKFITDPWAPRRFYTKRINRTLKMSDPVPDEVARPKTKSTGSIIDYSFQAWRRTKLSRVFTEGQPVVEAEIIPLRRNMLAAPEQKEVSVSTKAYLCLEPLRISALTPAIAASLFYWPAIIHRLESYLICMDGCASVGVACAPDLALAAFTKDSDNQGEHENQDRVNFQHGMGDNYERLEFIGDTFLKTATTISTFILNPNENEFEFHVRRMQMLCNQNLFENALEYKLYEYIRSMTFSRRTWYPEGMKLIKGTGVKFGEEKVTFYDGKKHILGQKTIADVCEALIGAAFVSHDRPDEPWQPSHWEAAIHAVTKFVVSPDHIMLTMDDYKKAYEKPAYQIAQVTAVQRDLAQKVQLEHDYSFRYPRLLYSAFSHPSNAYMQQQVPSYQRLEFLGDALLDQASIAYLFYKYPEADPQWLTEHKMAMVSNKFLGALCVNIGFHKHLRHSHAKIGSQVKTYVEELVEARETADGSRDYWTTVSDPPKCLPDIVEAFVGAMFIDSDFDFGQVQRFFQQHVRWFFEDMSIYDTFANNHPCTHLHQRLQTGFGCVDYRLMAKELPGVDGLESRDVVAVVMIHDRIVASAGGKGGRYARLRVAKRALEALDGLAPFEFRTKFSCDCRTVDGEDGGTTAPAIANMGADCGV